MTVHSETSSLTERKIFSDHESSSKTSVNDDLSANDIPKNEIKDTEKKVDIVWVNVLGISILHILAVYGLKLMIFDVNWKTSLICVFTHILSIVGVGAGAHRLWCHRAYSATLPLRLFLTICNCVGFQDCIFDWARNHRVHHKHTETDADPYNAKRGFFFAHIGWLMCRKHPEVLEKGNRLDLSDLRSDPLVMFQRKYFLWLGQFFSMLLPMAVPYYYWNENLWHSFLVCFVVRYVFGIHAQGMVNSAAHLWGDKPYDKTILPSENLLANALTWGEGFHNYHHTFPWDYSASEWGSKLNLSTAFIDVCSQLGLAYDLKKVPQEIVDRRRQVKGDGSKVWYPDKLS